MNEIVQSVRRVADVIGEITAAASEQSGGIAQVNTSIANLDQMTQQNAALVEQSAAAAQSLREQADQLAQAIAVFKLAGHAAPPRLAPAPAPVRAEPVAARPAAPRAVPASSPPVQTARRAGDDGDWESF
jgi:hypothetical protein